MTDDLVGRHRAALIEAGREAGAFLADDVSDDFLLYVPGEVKGCIAKLSARIEALEAAITQALSCTPHINMKRGNVGQPVSEIIYDCGDPWEILRTALTPEAGRG